MKYLISRFSFEPREDQPLEKVPLAVVLILLEDFQ